MRTRAAAIAVIALAASGLAFSDPVVSPDADEHCVQLRGADTTDDATDDIQACRTDVWFHDVGTKVDNLDNAQGTFATWDTTPPDTSVTGGAGAGALGTSLLHQTEGPWDERESFVAAGRVDGALDSVLVELYLFPLQDTADGNMAYNLDAQLEVDGHQVATLGGAVVEMEVAGDAVRRIRFAFTGLADTIEEFHDFGAVGPLGGGHDVKLTVHGTGIASDAAVWVYDTTEVPAGMVVNPPADLLGSDG